MSISGIIKVTIMNGCAYFMFQMEIKLSIMVQIKSRVMSPSRQMLNLDETTATYLLMHVCQNIIMSSTVKRNGGQEYLCV